MMQMWWWTVRTFELGARNIDGALYPYRSLAGMRENGDEQADEFVGWRTESVDADCSVGRAEIRLLLIRHPHPRLFTLPLSHSFRYFTTLPTISRNCSR